MAKQAKVAKKPIFILAPMDDVTDTVFRQIIADCQKPDLFFTEFTNVDGLQSPGRENLIKKLKFDPKETPVVAQIWGKNPENYFKTAKELVKMGFAGIDINMGCPVKTIVKNGCCAALINNRNLAQEIIDATKRGAQNKLPISVKTRLGFNEVDLEWIEFLLRNNLDMLTIHGRTAKQMSKVPANWDLIGQVVVLRDKLSPKTKIVGNGDVLSHIQAINLAKKYNLDGVMIGRGVFQDPFVFSSNSPWGSYSPSQKIELFTKHVDLFVKTWGEQKPVRILNKFCKIYIQGFDKAKELREELMSTDSISELKKMLKLALLQY